MCGTAVSPATVLFQVSRGHVQQLLQFTVTVLGLKSRIQQLLPQLVLDLKRSLQLSPPFGSPLKLLLVLVAPVVWTTNDLKVRAITCTCPGQVLVVVPDKYFLKKLRN